MATKLILGCGYLGRRVAARWNELGHRVLAATRRSATHIEFQRLGYVPILLDLMCPEAFPPLPVVDTVLFAVGFDRQSGHSMRQLYVDGLGHFLKRLPMPGQFLYVSSTSVYGQSGGEWVDECAATEPSEENGKIVLEAEQLLEVQYPAATRLRFAGIYGPGRLLRRQALEAGQPIVGDPERWLNLIHIDDGVGAVLAAEERSRPGAIYNIADGQPVRRRAFFEVLAQSLGLPAPSFVPLAPGAPAAHERGQRRIANQRMKSELGLVLRHPSFESGIRVSV